MHRNRLEAFSDGVFAIVITVMVIELRPPSGSDWDALYSLAPVLFAYLLSFVYVAIYWNNHHHLLHTVTHVNGLVLWANSNLLFWLSLIPFATAWLGSNHMATAPTALYGAVLLMPAIAYLLLQWVIVFTHGRESTLARAVGGDAKGKISVLLYFCGVLLAFVHPALADAAYVLVAFLWLFPDQRIEKALEDEPAEAHPSQPRDAALLSGAGTPPRARLDVRPIQGAPP